MTSTSPSAGFGGAVLCGGASRRMGRDKALVEVDGRAMALRVADALRQAGATPVVAVGGDLDRLRALGLDALADRVPAQGPLGGLVTALGTGTPEVLVVSCDLVTPSPVAMRTVMDALRRRQDADVAVPLAGGRPQWAHAAWRSSALPALQDALRAGDLALHRASRRLTVTEVDGVDAAALLDADTPDELPRTTRFDEMDVPEIGVEELARLHPHGVHLIDVREDDEFLDAHVPGAVHIPLGDVADRVDAVPRSGTVHVICARGGRSAKAVEYYRSLGIDAVNVAGGTIGWVEGGHPVASGPDA